jgi:tripartite-type tricarboxylate transporter receptor subunit TctC
VGGVLYSSFERLRANSGSKGYDDNIRFKDLPASEKRKEEHRMKGTKTLTLFLTVLLVLGLASVGFVADFPTKPIRYIVPKPLAKELGTKVYVENIPGGGTKVETFECMKAKPDGYTIMQATEIAWMGIYYSKSLDTKVWEKMTPIANTALESLCIFEVKVDSPFKTFADLVKAARENPGKLTVGTSSRGVLDIMLASVEKAARIKIKIVPFTGGGPGLVALLGGHIDVKFGSPSEAVGNIRAGKTRGLAVQADSRIPGLADVPTVKESGYDVLLVTATRTIWGPPNLPQNIVNVLSEAIEKSTKDPEFVKMVEETFINKIVFRRGPEVMEAARNMDKQLGPLLAEYYREN